MSSKLDISAAPIEARKTLQISLSEPVSLPHPQFPGMTLSFQSAQLTLVAYYDRREETWKPRSFDDGPFELEVGGARFYSFEKADNKPWELGALIHPELKKQLKHDYLRPFIEELNGSPDVAESDRPIAIDSPNRQGLGRQDLESALSKLLYRYGPGNEPQRRALQRALNDLGGID